ncbi:MAG: AAA family ATPase [Candidatus Electrothrix sp. Rat3]|nr:AAA family ATPase [Candidatus Electrothrix rattekaaiensis]
MKIISIFNNKGGVGKTTLTYHLAHILAEMGKRVLILDLDPQCNISLYGMSETELEKIWHDEDKIIDNGFESAKRQMESDDFDNLFNEVRSIHFLLKSVEEGISDFEKLTPPFKINDNLDLIPGRLTLFMYENKISERWSGMFLGEPLSIRTITKIRKISEIYSEKNKYDFVITDTSPSLGMLNKIIISTADGFIIPCLPDMFSLYGIKNIGKSLTQWQREFNTSRSIVSEAKLKEFPNKFVRFLGYTIYNAKKRSDSTNDWDLAKAHYNHAKEIPDAIREYIDKDVRKQLPDETVAIPIGGDAIMHSHNTFPAMAQKYKKPIWELPSYEGLDAEDRGTIIANRKKYEASKESYRNFATDFIKRVESIDD